MLPALVSAMCACTWHFFENSPSLEWIVTLQASMTVIGNFTLFAAAWWIYRSTQTNNTETNEASAKAVKSEQS